MDSRQLNALPTPASQIESMQRALTDLRTECDALRKDAERYRYVRTLNVVQFAALFTANLKGSGPFDELVDAALQGQTP